MLNPVSHYRISRSPTGESRSLSPRGHRLACLVLPLTRSFSLFPPPLPNLGHEPEKFDHDLKKLTTHCGNGAYTGCVHKVSSVPWGSVGGCVWIFFSPVVPETGRRMMMMMMMMIDDDD